MQKSSSYLRYAWLANLICSVDYMSRPIVAAHYSHVTIRPGQLERVDDFVHVGVEKRQRAVGYLALTVVVVDKHQGIVGSKLAPPDAVVPQVRQPLIGVLADDVTEVFPVPEFRYSTDLYVFVRTNSIIASVTYLCIGNTAHQ